MMSKVRVIYCDCDCKWCELLHQDTDNQEIILDVLKSYLALVKGTTRITLVGENKLIKLIRELRRKLNNE